MRRFWISDFGFWIGRGEMREVPGGRSLSTFHLKPPPKRRSAFTLIELLGVMAIIGILAAVVLPPMIARIEDAQTTNEDANLEEIARALLAGIKAEGRIPNPNVNPTDSQGWAAMATNYSILGTNAVIRSVLNSTNDTVRRYFLSPQLTNFLAGSYSSGSSWSTNSFPASAYFVLVSVSKDDFRFAQGCTTNANLASNDIIWLQNWAKTYNTAGRVTVDNLNVVGTIEGTTNRWTNRGQFLHVKVVNLRDLLCRIQLVDGAAPVTAVKGSGPTDPAATVVVSTNGYSVDLAYWPTPIIVGQPATANFNLFSSGSSDKNEYRVTFIVGTYSYPTDFILARTPGYSFSSTAAPTLIANYLPVGNPSRTNSVSFVVLYGTPIYLWDNASPTRNLSGGPFIAKKNNHFLIYNGAWSEE